MEDPPSSSSPTGSRSTEYGSLVLVTSLLVGQEASPPPGILPDGPTPGATHRRKDNNDTVPPQWTHDGGSGDDDDGSSNSRSRNSLDDLRKRVTAVVMLTAVVALCTSRLLLPRTRRPCQSSFVGTTTSSYQHHHLCGSKEAGMAALSSNKDNHGQIKSVPMVQPTWGATQSTPGTSDNPPPLPAWTVLPWHPLEEASFAGPTRQPVHNRFIGYLQLCEIPWRDGTQRLMYQVAHVVQPSRTDPATLNSTANPSAIALCDLQPSSLAAPLIRMVPGNHYTLVLINNANEPTNLHTHGLHISGVGTVDDVTRSVPPGQCLVYHYHIFSDTDVGTFWYHSHLFPLAASQVARGAFGPLIVDETPAVRDSFYPPHLQAFWQSEILLQYASVRGGPTSAPTRTVLLNGQTRTWATDPNVSSAVAPMFHLPLIRDRWYYLRLSFNVHFDTINFFALAPTEACEVRIVAYDGVYRSRIPSEFRLTRPHMMTTSSRADLAVRCTAPSAWLHFYPQQQPPGEDDDTGPSHNQTALVHIRTSLFDETLLNTTTTGTRESKGFPSDGDQKQEEEESSSSSSSSSDVEPSPYWNASAQTQWSPRRSYYMSNLLLWNSSSTGNHTGEKLTNASNSVDIWEASMDDILRNGTVALSISQNRWNAAVPVRSIPLGQVAQWALVNTEAHPFHIHINRMQIVQPGGCGYRYEEGEYYDTIAAALPSCLVRLRFMDYAGRIVAHCHKLPHEDRGMMVWFNVTGGPGAGVSAGPPEQCVRVL